MFLQDIGRTIGQIFGGQPKKKREDQPRPFTGVATTPALNQQRAQGLPPARPVQQADPFTLQRQQVPQVQPPSTLGQPLQVQQTPVTQPVVTPPPSAAPLLLNRSQPVAQQPGQFVRQIPKSSNPINDVGKFLANNTAKLANTGYAGIQGAVGLGSALTSQALGDRAGADRIAAATEQEMNRTFNKGGLFDAGGFFKSSEDARNIDQGEFTKRFVGAGLGTAGEIAPIGKGLTLAGKVTKPALVSLAKQGAAIGGLGSAGSQLTTTGQINPFETAASALSGGVLAPGSAITGKIATPLINKYGEKILGSRPAEYLFGDKQIVQNAQKPSVSFKNTLDQLPHNRSVDKLQTQIEQAHNSGDNEAVQKLIPQLPNDLQSSTRSALGLPKTTNDYLDQLLGNIGVDTEKGLVKGNALYNNPITKGFNKAQQGYIEGVDKLRDKVASGLQSGLESKNPITSGLTRLPQVGFKNFGQSDLNRQIFDTRSSKIEAAGKVSQLVQEDLNKAVKATGNPENTYKRIYQVLEDPDYLKKVYGDSTKISINDLNPQERIAMDKLIASNKVRNDVNLANEDITPEMHAQFKDGFHSPRMYDLTTGTSPMGNTTMLDKKAFIKRKDINLIDDEITSKALKDPTLASSVRLETALRNKANREALDEMSQAGLIRPNAPNKNYVKLEGKKYGKHDGQYIDKQIKSQLDQTDYFNSGVGQQTGDLVKSYQDTKLGSLDRLNKKVKTVFAPATNIGNITSNIGAFSGAANVNPATMTIRMAQAGRQLYKHSKGFDPNVYRAEKAGLFAGDTGKQLLGTNDEALRTLQKSSKNPIKKIESFYGNTDKAAAQGLFNELIARGLNDAQAVRRVHKATQNYGNAGRGINLLADSPIIGKPFARFTPELLRIAKNNALYNPLGTAAKVGGLAAGSAVLSQAAGETTEERQAREGAVGQTALPYTGGINSLITGGKNKDNVSLNLPIGDSAVNIARATGLNFPIEPGGDPNSALTRQLSPVADMTRKTADGKEVFAPNQTVSSLTFKPVFDQLANRDFMGREITDPSNKVRSEIGNGKSQYENPDGSRQSPGKDAEQQNRIGNAIQNYVPLANEGNALLSAVQGKEDYYGKKRSLPEAALRTVGLKTESNAKDVREKRVQNKEFFDGKDKQVKDFLTKNEDIADDYFKFNDSSRDRFTNKKSSALVKPEKWGVVKGETSGKLFNQLKQEALDDNKKDGKPIDPIYQLNDPARQKELINLRATPPGEDIERQEILRATSNWFKPFEDAESKYYKDSSAYYDKLPKSKKPADQNDRVKEYGEVAYPEQTDLVKGYYQAKSEDPQKGKDYFKSHADALSKDFTDYKTAKLDNINKKRDILGLDPIKPDTFNNITFGYEDDEKKVAQELYFKGAGGYSRGSRGGSGGGSSSPDLGKSDASYAVSLKSGGSIAKPSVSIKKVTPISNKSKVSIAKPKVSLKKGSMKGAKA